MLTATGAWAGNKTITSPDGKLMVNVSDSAGFLTYSVDYDGQRMLKPSRLGLKADFGDLTTGLAIKASRDYRVDRSYEEYIDILFHCIVSELECYINTYNYLLSEWECHSTTTL